jgi:polar amino acid transport system permease protein
VSYVFQFGAVWQEWDKLLLGTWLTVRLSAITMVLGLGVGILGAVGRDSRHKTVRGLVRGYVEAIRNTPFLVQLLLVYLGLPSLGLRLTPEQAALLAMVVNLGAYATEIVRAGIEAVPRGQIEAGRALGLKSHQIFRFVVLVPALHTVFPALASQFILLMLATSVVSQISAQDLFHTASIVQSRTFRDFEVYIVIAAVYLALALVFRLLFAGLYQIVFARR